MAKNESHLPVYGVGPYYGAGVIALTAAGIALSAAGVLRAGRIGARAWIIALAVLGAALIVGGFLLWRAAALGKARIDEYIESNTLCTTGAYRVVRNPCYSGIALMCTGALLCAHNLFLLPLPVLYWAAMTVLMKCTEEKWLAALYGQEYRDYCARVNRCIPWFPKQ